MFNSRLCLVMQSHSMSMLINGSLQGYGFVHFETEEAAMNAIQKVNGMLLNEKKVTILVLSSGPTLSCSINISLARLNIKMGNFPLSSSVAEIITG